MGSVLPELKEKEFEDFLKEKGSGIIEFGAPWCGACKATEPELVKLSSKFPDLKIFKIDVGKSPKVTSKMGVMSLPNVMFIKAGKVVEQTIGAASEKQFEEKVKKTFSHI